jgi:hypothetical protein
LATIERHGDANLTDLLQTIVMTPLFRRPLNGTDVEGRAAR